jgi:hypothetical protein
VIDITDLLNDSKIPPLSQQPTRSIKIQQCGNDLSPVGVDSLAFIYAGDKAPLDKLSRSSGSWKQFSVRLENSVISRAAMARLLPRTVVGSKEADNLAEGRSETQGQHGIFNATLHSN